MPFIPKCYQMLIARHLKKGGKNMNNDILFSVAAFYQPLFKGSRSVMPIMNFHFMPAIWSADAVQFI